MNKRIEQLILNSEEIKTTSKQAVIFHIKNYDTYVEDSFSKLLNDLSQEQKLSKMHEELTALKLKDNNFDLTYVKKLENVHEELKSSQQTCVRKVC